MTTHSIVLNGLAIDVPHGWQEITTPVLDNDAPYTLAEPRCGVGALQISIARYRRGARPEVTLSSLQELLDDFAFKKDLEHRHDISKASGAVSIVGASFHKDMDFIRVWYVSNGDDVALVTYVCNWNARGAEAIQCEEIVASMRFVDADNS